MCPAKFLASQCKSSCPRSSVRTSSVPRDRTHETCPNYSNVPLNWNCTAKHGAHTHVYEKSPPVFRIAPKAFRRFPIRAALSQSHENFPSCAPLFPFPRTPPALPASPQPPDPNYSSASAERLPAASPYRKFPSHAPRETALCSAPPPPLSSPYSSPSPLRTLQVHFSAPSPSGTKLRFVLGCPLEKRLCG